MPRFSINVSMMLGEYDFLDRFAAAADLGFEGVDIQFPYEHDAEAVAERARRAGVEIVLINLPAGDLTTGGDGLACVPGREAAFDEAIEQARAYAGVLGAERVNVLAGRVPEGCAPNLARETLTGSLRRAADAFVPDGVTVMMEPCNRFDVPRYCVDRTEEAVAIIAEADRPNLAIQYDFYHRQMTQGRLIDGLRDNLAKIAHIQFADVPGRHEPGTGEVDFANVFSAIDESGYRGWVGAEYRPRGRTEDSLNWSRF